MKKPLEKTPYLFVYGTLMKDFGNHLLIKNTEFVDRGSTVNEYKLVATGIPFMLEQESSYNVVGEIYKIDDNTLRSVDALEGHPSVYERKIIKVVNEVGDVIDAWAYFYVAGRGHGTEIKSGSYRDYAYTFKHQY